VKGSDRHETKAASLKRFRESSDPGDAERVKSIKVLGDWDRDGGTLDKTRMTYHSSVNPRRSNVMGPPVTINRPLTLHLDNVPPEHKESVAQAIRGAHEMMAREPNHPAALANYGFVSTPPTPHGPNGGRVVVGMEHVSEDERRRNYLGVYAINTNPTDRGTNRGPPSHAGPSHAGPSEVLQPTHSGQASNSESNGTGPPPASSSSSDAASSHHSAPGSPDDSEVTSRFTPNKQKTS
jgi:hypothetical protein